MDGDMNDIFQKLNSILSDKETSDNLKNILNNFSSSNNSSTESTEEKTNTHTTQNSNNQNNTTQTASSSNNGSAIPEFDINTIIKLKSIMDNFNNNKNDPRSNLLLSLKPYLADSKKEKVDQYIKFLNLAKVIEVMNPMAGGENKNE